MLLDTVKRLGAPEPFVAELGVFALWTDVEAQSAVELVVLCEGRADGQSEDSVGEQIDVRDREMIRVLLLQLVPGPTPIVVVFGQFGDLWVIFLQKLLLFAPLMQVGFLQRVDITPAATFDASHSGLEPEVLHLLWQVNKVGIVDIGLQNPV